MFDQQNQAREGYEQTFANCIAKLELPQIMNY